MDFFFSLSRSSTSRSASPLSVDTGRLVSRLLLFDCIWSCLFDNKSKMAVWLHFICFFICLMSFLTSAIPCRRALYSKRWTLAINCFYFTFFLLREGKVNLTQIVISIKFHWHMYITYNYELIKLYIGWACFYSHVSKNV